MPEIRMSELWPWLPKQAEATKAADTHRYTLYGGSRGPGKSWWLRRYLLRYLVKVYEVLNLSNVRVMLACEDYPSLQDRHLSKIATEFPAWLGRYNAQAREFRLMKTLGGGVLCFRNLDDPSKYQSAEFAAIGVDELTKNDKSTFDILRGSLRWPGIENVRFVAATNPGGRGHLWVKDLWVDRVYPEELEDQAHEFAFIKALPADNPYLPDSYWEMLNSLPPDLARAWVEGDWDVFEGQVFTEWRRDAHVVEPVAIPENWLRWRAIDWGHSAPFCCLWLARDPDTGRVVVYREAYQAGLTDPEQAELVRDMTNDDERIELTLADPSMWTARTLERQTRSTADVYRENGVPLTRADNDRLTGLRRVRDSLQLLEDGRPALLVFENCRNLIRTLPALPYDRVRVEDVDTDAEDHCFVAGTLVACEFGDVPIEEVQAGMRVWTRRGLREVKLAWKTQDKAQVYRLRMNDGRELIGTGNHKIWKEGAGWTRLQNLQAGDRLTTLSWCHLQSKNGTGCGFIDAVSTFAKEASSCIGRFGRTALGLSQTGGTFITSMATGTITDCLTWRSFLQPSTPKCTQRNRPIHSEWQERGTPENLHQLETQGLPKNNDPRQPGRGGLAKSRWSQRVRSVALNSIPTFRAVQNSVGTSVGSVLSVSGAGTAPVYNLHVDSVHEYYANGILVSNCYDALRYALAWKTKARKATELPDRIDYWARARNQKKRRVSVYG